MSLLSIPDDFGQGGANIGDGDIRLVDILKNHAAEIEALDVGGSVDSVARAAAAAAASAAATAQTTANGAVTVNTAQTASIATKAPLAAPVFTSTVKVTTGLSSWNVTPPVSQPAVGASLTNNVPLTGSANVLPDFTDGTTYATDYPNLHATISQMAHKIAALELALKGDGTVQT